MPSTATDYFKKAPPEELRGVYAPSQSLFKKAGRCVDNTVVDEKLWAPQKMQKSLAGRVPGGLNDSTGFIVTTTTAQATQRQQLEEDTLDAWNKSRQPILQCAQRRQQLATQPFATEEPEHFLTTYQAHHLNFLPAITGDAKDFVFKDAQPRGCIRKAAGDESPIAEDVDPEQVRAYGLAFGERDEAASDTAALHAALKEMQSHGVMLSRNGTTARSEDTPLNATLNRPALTRHVQPLLTTSQETSSKLHPMFYVDPNQLPPVDLTAEEEEYVRSKMGSSGRAPALTTYATSFQPVTADVATLHRKAHYLDKVQGTLQHPRLQPTLRPNNFQNTQRMADVVPSQYTTTSMSNNSNVAAAVC